MLDAALLVELFDPLPDQVFFIKDRAGRYTHANRTLLARLGLRTAGQLLGRTAREVFPAPLGERYLAQDLHVIGTGERLVDELEWHLFPNFAHGWCLTQKLPVIERGRVVGVIGLSRDVREAPTAAALGRLRDSLRYAERNLAEPLRIADLAARAGYSLAQFERHMARRFHMTPSQWLLARRLERAMQLTAGGAPIAAIAHACGFADHSAFSRAFRRHVGLSPREYRALHGGRINSAASSSPP
jgi:AraC-like DNA-binding protein